MSAPRQPEGRLLVTDHAMFRWLQQAGVVDFEPIRQALAIALDRPFKAVEKIGGGEFLILQGGLVFVVRDGVLITVLPDDGRHTHARSFQRGDAPAGANAGA